MKRIWIKLFVEVLDDPKMGRLTNHLWRRAIELFLLAGRNGDDGLLPPVEEMTWVLRLDKPKLLEDLIGLAEVGVVHETPLGWVVTHFKDRQYSESYERVKKLREKKRYSNGESNEERNEDVAENESTSTSVSDSVSEREGVGERDQPFPKTPREAVEHPDIKVFQEICGRVPGERDYALVIDTIRFLRGKHGAKLIANVTPYWLAWSSRKGKNGKKYNPAMLVWLTEWAVNDEIPGENDVIVKPPSRDPYASLTEYLQEAK